MTKANKTVDEILANMEDSGIEWGYGPLHYRDGTSKILLADNAPHIVHLDVEKITETFGADYLLNGANGTSHRVRDQHVIREAIRKDRRVRDNMEAMKRAVISAALGNRAPRTRTVVTVEKIVVQEVVRFAGPPDADGNPEMFMTQVEAQAAWMAYMVDQGQK